jgi:hypothetical protein
MGDQPQGDQKKTGESDSLSPASVFSPAAYLFLSAASARLAHGDFPFPWLLVCRDGMRVPSDRFNLTGTGGRLDKFSLRRAHFTKTAKLREEQPWLTR